MKPFEKPVYVTRPVLPDLEELLSKLREIWESQWISNNGPQHELLGKRLAEGLSFPAAGHPNVEDCSQYLMIRIDEELFRVSRDHVYEKFKKYNVFTRKYFHPLCSEYDCYKYLPSSDPANLPIANKVALEVLSLPYYGGLSEDAVRNICNILKSFR